MSDPGNTSAAVSISSTRTKGTPENILDAAWNALGCVYDPELCLDVVSLGLVYDVHEEAGAVVVEMTLTTPGCPASESLSELARAAIEDAVGVVSRVEVRVVWDPPWNPTMMSDKAASALGFRIR